MPLARALLSGTSVCSCCEQAARARAQGPERVQEHSIYAGIIPNIVASCSEESYSTYASKGYWYLLKRPQRRHLDLAFYVGCRMPQRPMALR